MCFFISTHFFVKGNILPDVTKPIEINGIIIWFMQTITHISINLFVLISGYFSTRKSARISKILDLWIQVFFYSFVIGIIAILLGVQEFDKYAIIQLIFPVSTEHYWFMTAFFLVSFLAPILHNGMENIDKKTFMQMIMGLIILNSVAKSVLPMKLPLDKNGYDFIWMLCMYLTGMYLKKFDLPKVLQNRIKSGLICVLCLFGVFFSMLIIRRIYLQTGKYEDFITYAYSHNFILCYLGSIACFAFFLKGKENIPGIGKLINKLGGTTLGVYLIHEHKNIRYVWPAFFSPQKMYEMPPVLFLLAVIFTISCVFLVCAVIELLRQKIFHIIKHGRKKKYEKAE